MRSCFSLELPAQMRILARVAVKRTPTPASEKIQLAQKRALIRSLIEQHGWSSAAPESVPHAMGKRDPFPSNVIPFPATAR